MNCDNCDKPLEGGKHLLFDVRWPDRADGEEKHVHSECRAEFESRMAGEGAEVELVESIDDSRNAEWTPEGGRPEVGR